MVSDNADCQRDMLQATSKVFWIQLEICQDVLPLGPTGKNDQLLTGMMVDGCIRFFVTW